MEGGLEIESCCQCPSLQGQIALAADEITDCIAAHKAHELILAKVDMVFPSGLDAEVNPFIICPRIKTQSQFQIGNRTGSSKRPVGICPIEFNTIAELIFSIHIMESIKERPGSIRIDAKATAKTPLSIQSPFQAKAPELGFHVDMVIDAGGKGTCRFAQAVIVGVELLMQPCCTQSNVGTERHPFADIILPS